MTSTAEMSAKLREAAIRYRERAEDPGLDESLNMAAAIFCSDVADRLDWLIRILSTFEADLADLEGNRKEFRDRYAGRFAEFFPIRPEDGHICLIVRKAKDLYEIRAALEGIHDSDSGDHHPLPALSDI